MIITLPQIAAFFLIFARIAGVFMMAPFFDRKQVFAMGKIALVFWTAMLFIFIVPLPKVMPQDAITFVLALLSEFLVGAILGFSASAILISIEFAGSLMDTQAGLSVAALLNPATGRTSTLISLLLEWTSIMLFLSIDGHHLVLAAMNKSFTLLPIGSPFNFNLAGEYLISLGTEIFKMAVQLASPILLVIFLMDFCFGMLSRIAPQINVFQMSFELKPSVSLLVFLAIIPGLVNSIYGLLESVTEHSLRILYLLR